MIQVIMGKKSSFEAIRIQGKDFKGRWHKEK